MKRSVLVCLALGVMTVLVGETTHSGPVPTVDRDTPVRLVREVYNDWLLRGDAGRYFDALPLAEEGLADEVSKAEVVWYLNHYFRPEYPAADLIMEPVKAELRAMNEEDGRAVVDLVMTVRAQEKVVTGRKPIEVRRYPTGNWRLGYSRLVLENLFLRRPLADVVAAYTRAWVRVTSGRPRTGDAGSALAHLSGKLARRVAGDPPTPDGLKQHWEKEKERLDAGGAGALVVVSPGRISRDGRGSAKVRLSTLFKRPTELRGTPGEGEAQLVLDPASGRWLIDGITVDVPDRGASTPSGADSPATANPALPNLDQSAGQ